MYMPSIFRENLFDDFFEDFARPMRRIGGLSQIASGGMRTDVKERDGGYELHIELPGYKKEDVKAELKDGYMTITAEKNTESDKKDEEGNYIRRERFYGSCSRSFYVGKDITEEDIKAKFEDGVLRVMVPKKEAKEVIPQKKFISIEG